ncbi:trehalose-phosphatase [Stutzerimonas urumqiensis]|uniref:trehalose-phosphatase n=1 Tax=Stutzerimonas urumqiensis TaxID=638269 RepID=UPI003DA46567
MTDLDAPPVLDIQRTALFLDLDGTLADLQLRPEAVFIPATTLDTLAALQSKGAQLAVVSGRRIDDIDRLLAPLRLPAAGIHGAERRDAEGRVERVSLDAGLLSAIEEELETACRELPGLRLESKGMAFALHYRGAPERKDDARRLAEACANRHADLLRLQPGKCVFELKPRSASKGAAIEAFMAQRPFAGRQAVFVGDDLTDEAAFPVVEGLGGLSIRVGPGDTCARYRLEGVADVARWLRGLLGPSVSEGGINKNLGGELI